jgi:hypothetical protein
MVPSSPVLLLWLHGTSPSQSQTSIRVLLVLLGIGAEAGVAGADGKHGS